MEALVKEYDLNGKGQINEVLSKAIREYNIIYL